MFRTSDIVLIAVMVSAAALTYKTKREAEDQLAAVQKLQAQIRYEEDTIDLLKADWSLLTQPARLQKLAEIYKSQLGLEPLNIEDLSSQPLGGMADNSGKGPSDGKDPVVTGSTVQ
ncbi:MAG: hypothetical protein E5Y26_32730 [Mesorhizobium sp.]|nr:MAG: hypothetical protein E5Y26_32730 [Mesorhizobium sp.]